MADPVGFEGANGVLLAPDSMSPDECCDLEIFKTPDQIISCWRLTPEELAEVVRTGGVVWLSVFGSVAPPVALSGKALVEVGGKPSKAEPVLPRARRREETA